MILKIPIYLEVDSISAEAASSLVEVCNKKFTIILRKEKITTFKFTDDERDLVTISNLKIISREKALESLRTGR